MNRLFLLIFAVLCFAPLSATAQQVFDFEATGETLPGEGEGGRGAQLTINWGAQVKIGSLLGEPLVSSRFRFDLLGGKVTLPSSNTDGTSRYETYALSSLPQVAQDKIALYDVKLRVDFHGGTDDFYLITDVGLPGKSGEWSFNVPESPDWDKLFIRGSSKADDPIYLDAARAKREVSNGLSLQSGYVVEAHLSLFDLHNWYAAQNPDYYIAAYGTAIRRLEEGMRISYGINEITPEEGEIVFGRTVADRLDTADFYKRRLEKLMDIPDRFRIGSNDAPYLEAQKQARHIVRAAKTIEPSFYNDQPRLPGGRKPGSEASFFAGYTLSVQNYAEYIVEKDTGKRVAKLEYLKSLVLERYVSSKYASECKGGISTLDLKDPKTGQIVEQVKMKCPVGASRPRLYGINDFDSRILIHMPILKYTGTSSYKTWKGTAHECLYDEYTYVVEIGPDLQIYRAEMLDKIKLSTSGRKSATWRCRQPYYD